MRHARVMCRVYLYGKLKIYITRIATYHNTFLCRSVMYIEECNRIRLRVALSISAI